MKAKNVLIALALLTMAGSGHAQNLPSYVPANGLVGWWPFNCNANDESGNSNNGTVNGATLTTDRFGNAGKAYGFDGVGSYIEVNNSSSLNFQNGTIAFWSKTEDTTNIMIPLVKNNYIDATGEQFVFSINSSESFGVKYNSSCQTGFGWNYVGGNNPNLSNGNWHLIIGSFGESVKFYIDGLLVSSIIAPSNNSDNCSGNIQFGRAWSVYPYHFSGTLDDIAIYNRALTQQEITAMYQGANSTTNCPTFPASLAQGLVGYWPFCGNALDESGNGNHGTVNGATLTADRFGNQGSAYSFNGNGAKIDVPNSNSLNPSNITMNAWVNGSNTNSRGYILTKRTKNQTPTEFSYSLHITENNAIAAHYGVGQCNELSGFNPETGINQYSPMNWMMVTASITSDGICKIYKNGLLDTMITGLPYLPCNSSTTHLQFGYSWQNPPEDYFSGSLDDIAIWNRALSQSEITQLYNQGICNTSITVTDTLLIHTGITAYNPVAYQNTLKVWPNPGNQDITLDAGNLASMQGWKYKVANGLGQMVVNETAINQQQTTINLSSWGGHGIYYLHLINPQGIAVEIKKIVLAP